jgi:hypothetical protein
MSIMKSIYNAVISSPHFICNVHDTYMYNIIDLQHAIRLTSGEASILGILDEAKRRVDEEYARRSHKADVRSARDALSDLLEKASDSIVGERGDEDILHDAFVDGSSVICSKCGALIKRDRSEAHSKKWCPALPKSERDRGSNTGSDDDSDIDA